MNDNFEFMKISEKEDLMDVMTKVLNETVCDLVGSGADVPEFECTYDDEKTYQFLWKEKWEGFGYFAAFIESNEIEKFVEESKKYVKEIGFDPLNPGEGMEIVTKVYVYSPDGFPEEGIKSLLSVTDEYYGDVYIVLVTTDKIIKKHRSYFSSEKKMKKKMMIPF